MLSAKNQTYEFKILYFIEKVYFHYWKKNKFKSASLTRNSSHNYIFPNLIKFTNLQSCLDL